jgi:cobalamin biosynthesis protein CobT
MYIPDKKLLNDDYFARARALKEKVEYRRLEASGRLRVDRSKMEEKEARKISKEKHELVKLNNLEDLDKEALKKELFLKKALGLNII